MEKSISLRVRCGGQGCRLMVDPFTAQGLAARILSQSLWNLKLQVKVILSSDWKETFSPKFHVVPKTTIIARKLIALSEINLPMMVSSLATLMLSSFMVSSREFMWSREYAFVLAINAFGEANRFGDAKILGILIEMWVLKAGDGI